MDAEPAHELLVPGAFAHASAACNMPLDGEWEFCEIPAGQGRDAADRGWRPARVPGTVAAALRLLGAGTEGIDAREFLFRKRFRHESLGSPRLVMDGLATLAEVWLNGACLLSTRNMFRRYAADAVGLLSGENELVLHFRSLDAELSRARPRGRWPARMVRHRNLRYVRTSLLGRIPGWSSSSPPVGPWRGVRVVDGERVRLERLGLTPTLANDEGRLAVALRGRRIRGKAPMQLRIQVGEHSFTAPVQARGDTFEARTELGVPGVLPWWSHNLGTPHRYAVTLSLLADDAKLELGTTHVGFRRVERAGAHDPFALRLNGREVFCRGACWTPPDPVGFRADAGEVRRVLELVRDAGLNMLRLNGTFVYEDDSFYEACDELGILVWQDFMFSRMDYPEGDAEFIREVGLEAEQVLARIHHRPSLAVLCGNNEVEQQASMVGLPPEAGCTPLFAQLLPQASSLWCPEVPYVTSSPTGGALPFHANAGIAHYFGVGAYLRPLADARESGVGFASECLAFSNVPEDENLDELLREEPRVVHSPRYKAGVPRDPGAGWDFADVTDHYVEQLFGCNARELRYADTERYLALSRVATGEMMARAMGVWRASDSRCRGALVWFLRDLEPGGGWGILDSAGHPKAPYWFLRRACAATAIWFTDEGLNGLRLHVHHDRPSGLEAQMRVRLLRGDGVEVAAARSELRIDPHGAQAFSVERLLGRFADSTWAYRFGSCPYVIAVAEIADGDGVMLGSAHYLPAGLGHEVRDDIGLRAGIYQAGGGHRIRVETRELALFVRVTCPGSLLSDNYFHLAPGGSREIGLQGGGQGGPRVRVQALNARAEAAVEVSPSP